MRFLLFFLLIFCFFLRPKAQDKLFFTNGSTLNGIIVSNAKEFIYFKKTDTSQTEKINKTSLILVEDYKGNRYIYGSMQTEPKKENVPSVNSEAKKNILSLQPFGFLFGRISLQYERLTNDLRFGIVVPFALTFNPYGTIYPSRNDSTFTEVTGVNFITGLDVNYYLGKTESFQFFIGPRIRYGTDLFVFGGGIHGYSIQTQFGWKVGKPSGRFIQHISFGFGFIRVISYQSVQTVDANQSYAWGSINYRLGIKW